jgi:hypothetical protein
VQQGTIHLMWVAPIAAASSLAAFFACVAAFSSLSLAVP